MSIQLLAHQKPHFEAIVNLLESGENKYIDCSLMGSGKTYIALAIAQKYNLDLFVVCPKSMKKNWETTANKHNIKVVKTISYQTLSGKGDKVNHPFLLKEKTGTKANFVITDEFKKLVEKGTLLVLDEIQFAKNNNSLSRACSTLTKAFWEHKKSKIAFLSATPYDKMECSKNILLLCNFIKSMRLYEIADNPFGFEMTGFNDIFNTCTKYNPDLAKSILFGEPKLNAKKVDSICHKLFTQILKQRFIYIMEPPKIDIQSDIKNSFYEINETGEKGKKLLEALTQFHNAIKASQIKEDKEKTKQPVAPENKWGAITKALMSLEESKVPLVACLAKSVLDENPSRKVIIYCNYTSVLYQFEELLKEYKPKLLYGATSETQRKRITTAFQKQNNKTRLLIGNTRVGGIGIDLHDTHGDFPRTMFILPSYSILNLHQATGRVNRMGVKSVPTIRFIYTKGIEIKLLESLILKSEVLEDITNKKEDTPVFPSAHPAEYIKYTF